MNSKTVRHANPQDISILTQIRNDAHANKLTHGDCAWGERALSEADVLNVLSSSFARKDLYIVELDSMPVASFSLCLAGERSDLETWASQDPNAAYVHRLCVRKGFNGLGLGSYIIDWCLSRLSALDRRILRLDCDARNAKLCAYYESLGFIRVDISPDASDGDYVASMYEKPIH
jgi:ribosomal protein S18 acetylase RimI-like enzyme